MTLLERIGGPDGDLLGLRRVLSGGAPGEGDPDQRRDLTSCYRDAEAIRLGLERRRADGFHAVLTEGDARVFQALGRRADDRLPIPAPIVPNIQGFMREAVEYGMLGAGMRRAWRVGPVALAGLIFRSVGRLPALGWRDFPTMLRSFVELELADFSRYDPPVVFLQAQMTDLALAMHNPRILEAFFEAVRNRTGALAALATLNFGTLAASLQAWGLEAAAILTPWDGAGHSLRPDAESCTRAARAIGSPIWADRLGRLEPPGTVDREAMRKAQLVGAARDDYTLWNVES